MFKKILIANRGEIAVRVLQTCREMGIQVVALYEAADRDSLHVRLADEVVELATGFTDGAAILKIAQERGAEAIHPGYGFLAERADFARDCAAAGITFIGPSAAVLAALHSKVAVLDQVRAAGFPTVDYAPQAFDGDEAALAQIAATLPPCPLVVKSSRGGRGPGERLVRQPDHLTEAVRSARAEASAVFGSTSVYFEKAILPARQIGVQIMGDRHGHLIHLGEREGSLLQGTQMLVEEAPAPCCNDAQRASLLQTALEIARLFHYDSAGTVEFVADDAGNFYFTEIKARLQTEHPLIEMVTQTDLVQMQLQVAAGDALELRQADIFTRGHAILCRVYTQDPLNRLLPRSGQITRLRLPTGGGVRADTYVYEGCDVPALYNPLIAKVTCRAGNRAAAVRRMQRALTEFIIQGVPANLPRLLEIVQAGFFVEGHYTTESLTHFAGSKDSQTALSDLAAIAAVLYLRRNALFAPVESERLKGGWHRSSRRLPE
jgi:acetyl-CoA carboxylase biotin carboxylase subunit